MDRYILAAKDLSTSKLTNQDWYTILKEALADPDEEIECQVVGRDTTHSKPMTGLEEEVALALRISIEMKAILIAKANGSNQI